jgi:ATP-dependent protease ClpP protease subunit
MDTFKLPKMQIEDQGDEVLMDLNGIIIPDMWTYYVLDDPSYHTASSLLMQMRDLSAKYKKINLMIGALYGGSVYEGKAVIANMYQLWSQGKLSAHVSSLAASMGAMMAIRLNASMDPFAEIMVHGASGGVYGTQQEVEAYAEDLKQTNQLMLEMLLQHSSLDEKEAKKLFVGDNFITAQKALEYGFISQVTDSPFGKKSTQTASLQNSKEMFNMFKNIRMDDVYHALKLKTNVMEENQTPKNTEAIDAAVAKALEPVTAQLAEKVQELSALKADIPNQIKVAVDAAVAVKESDFTAKLAEKDAVILALSKVPGAKQNSGDKGDGKTESVDVSPAVAHTRSFLQNKIANYKHLK